MTEELNEKEIERYWKERVKPVKIPPLKTKKAKELKKKYLKLVAILKTAGKLASDLGSFYANFVRYKALVEQYSVYESRLATSDTILIELLKEGEGLLDNWKRNPKPSYIFSSYQSFVTSSMLRINAYKANILTLNKSLIQNSNESKRSLKIMESKIKSATNEISKMLKQLKKLGYIGEEYVETWENMKKTFNYKVYIAHIKVVNIGSLNKLKPDRFLKVSVDKVPRQMFNLLSAILEFLLGKSVIRKTVINDKEVEVESTKQLIAYFDYIQKYSFFALRLLDYATKLLENETKLILKEPVDAMARAEDELAIKRAVISLKRAIRDITLYLDEIREKISLSDEWIAEFKKWGNKYIEYYEALIDYLGEERDKLAYLAEETLEKLAEELVNM